MIKTPQEIEAMRKGGKILGQILDTLESEIAPGVSTETLNDRAEALLEEAGCKPAFLGYEVPGNPPFPCSLCTSINEEVVHGVSVPGRTLEEGDIVGIDLGLIYTEEDTSVYLDSARTVGVGSISKEAKDLMKATKKSLQHAIEQVRPGNTTGDIGNAVEKIIDPLGYEIIRELVGHGVGREIHEDPQIPNYGNPGTGTKLEAGMTIAIEPMIAIGDWPVTFKPNSWRVITKDKSLSAHYEHTVLVTENGYEILT